MIKRLIYIGCCLVVLMLVSCKQEEDFKGPELLLPSGDLSLVKPLTISADKIDFKKTDTVYLEAEFNQVVSYEITIVGELSGATKRISGNGDQIKAPWIGDADGVFFMNEKCTASLRVLSNDELLDAVAFEIITVMLPPGNLIADFEPLGQNALLGFWEAPIDGKETRLFTDRTNEVAIQGNYAYKMTGQNNLDMTNRFLGLVFTKPIIGRNGINNSGAKYRVGSPNAEEVWFNIWVYGNGKDNSFLVIKFMQDDDDSGEHDGNRDNGFEYTIKDLNFKGWQLKSIRYDQLLTGNNQQFGGSGDKIHRPDKIAQIEFALWSKVVGTPVNLIFDYPIFTLNKPLGK